MTTAASWRAFGRSPCLYYVTIPIYATMLFLFSMSVSISYVLAMSIGGIGGGGGGMDGMNYSLKNLAASRIGCPGGRWMEWRWW